MSIPCNTMHHRGLRLRAPVLSPLAEALLRDKMGRTAPLPGWAYDDDHDEPDPDTFWDRMLFGDLR